MDLVTLFAAAIDTVPSTVPSAVPAPSPDGGGGGAFAWWDDLVPVIAALVGAGLGFWASAHQSKKDRAHAESMAAANREHTERMAQRHAVAEFLAEYGALMAEESAADVYNTARNLAMDMSAETWHKYGGRTMDDHIRALTEPIWRRFSTAYDVLQLRVTDPEVSKAAQDFYGDLEWLRTEGLADRLGPISGPAVAASLLSGDHSTGAAELARVAKDRLGMDPARPSKRRDTPAADADPNE